MNDNLDDCTMVADSFKAEEKFNLSNKIEKQGGNSWNCKEGFLDVEDVKEFVKRLKEELILDMDTLGRVSIGKREDIIFRIIDKLAGKELIWNKDSTE